MQVWQAGSNRLPAATTQVDGCGRAALSQAFLPPARGRRVTKGTPSSGSVSPKADENASLASSPGHTCSHMQETLAGDFTRAHLA